MPKTPERTRLQVLPVGGATSTGEERDGERNIPPGPTSVEQETSPRLYNSPIPQSREALANCVSWTFPLRTIHLPDGFFPLPTAARSAYPRRGGGGGRTQALR